jgi:hypothetical protein
MTLQLDVALQARVDVARTRKHELMWLLHASTSWCCSYMQARVDVALQAKVGVALTRRVGVALQGRVDMALIRKHQLV